MIFYSFDTSALLNGRRDLFRPTVFRSLWDRIEERISAGAIRAVDIVKEELSRRDDETYQWAETQAGLFCPLEEPIQLATRRVLQAHARLVGVGGKRSGADPFVVALALVKKGTVITEETASGNIEKPKIPDVCEDLDVPCLNLMGFIEEQNWTF